MIKSLFEACSCFSNRLINSWDVVSIKSKLQFASATTSIVTLIKPQDEGWTISLKNGVNLHVLFFLSLANKWQWQFAWIQEAIFQYPNEGQYDKTPFYFAAFAPQKLHLPITVVVQSGHHVRTQIVKDIIWQSTTHQVVVVALSSQMSRNCPT